MIFSLLGVAVLLAGFTFAASAHTAVEVRDFDIIALWETEPVVAGERNKLVVEITRDGAAIDNDTARMSLELEANGERRPVAAAPKDFVDPLRYEIEFIPTDIGEYTVYLDGLIGDESLTVSIAPEPVNAANILEFPDSGIFNNRSLQDLLIGVEERTIRAEQRANIGIAVGIGGVVVGAVGIVLGRREKQ